MADPTLTAFFHELNAAHFQGELPLPVLRWNSRLSSSAGRFCPGSRQLFRPRPPEIEVATYLRDVPGGAEHVRDTVLHEMVHYLLWYRRQPHGHTAEFNRILKKVGGKRYNTVPKERAFLHWYECPECREGFPTRRLLGISACARCCQRHNRGAFHERFRLVRLPAKPNRPTTILRSAKPPEAPPPEQRLTPAEIIRRLEDLKALVCVRK